ncbi:MAG: class I SAM-dependent methyltransferase [Pirellulales bacterium]|nr:class I SAM-dependent methyltransferase [Pirellulales bacterium]
MYHFPSYYDILNTPGTFEDINLYENIAKRFDVDLHRWLEPGCGTGRHLRVLAGRGYKVYGFDRDQHMLAYAQASLKNRAFSANLYRAEMDNFLSLLGTVRFDIAINPHSTIRHLLDQKNVISHLNQIASCLQPRGLYIVGLSLARYDKDRIESDLWLAARGLIHVRQEITYTPPSAGKRIEQVESQLTITRPSATETHTDGYRLRTYSARQWQDTLDQSKLKTVAILDEYGMDAGKKHLPYHLYVLSPRSVED